MKGDGAHVPSTAVAVSAIIWGLWWIPIRWLGESGLHGTWASFGVYAVSLLLFVPLGWLRRDTLRAGGVPLLLTGALFGLMMVLWNHAVLIGEVVRVVLLFYLAPVWATVLGVLVLGERVGRWRLVSIVLGLSGAAVVLGFEGGLPLPRAAAEWMGLAAGFLFALSATLARRAPDVSDVDKSTVSFVAALAAALVLAAFDPAPAPGLAVMLDAAPLAAFAAFAWMLPATFLVFWGASRLDPGRVSLLLLFEVVAAAISAAILTDEPFGAREIAGCVLILLAGVVEGVSAPRGPVVVPIPALTHTERNDAGR